MPSSQASPIQRRRLQLLVSCVRRIWLCVPVSKLKQSKPDAFPWSGMGDDSSETCSSAPRREVRGYFDGCFDTMHSGHYNALRQAKQFCDVLVVGVHSDEEITRNKGRPVMRQAERYELLSHVKWIDEIMYDTPYSPLMSTLAAARADFCIHGDDLPVGADGRGAYDEMRDNGKLKTVKRTVGVSTTDLIERILKATDESGQTACDFRYHLATTRLVAEFSPNRTPSRDDTIVYVDGMFDLFNIDHARVLEQAKAFGTFLIVGVHPDGQSRPVMNLLERVLNVCACRHVDEVIIDAPLTVTEEMLATMRISVVVCTGNRENYSVPERLEILREVPAVKLTAETIATRIGHDRDLYVARNKARPVVPAQC